MTDRPAISPMWIRDPKAPQWAMPVETAQGLGPDQALYGTLAGCVIHEGVLASAFERPVRAVDTWNGAEVARNGFSVAGLPPTGRRADYRIVATPQDGLIVPARAPSDLTS